MFKGYQGKNRTSVLLHTVKITPIIRVIIKNTTEVTICKIIVVNRELYMKDGCTMYRFDGTPFQAVEGEVVGEVPCLFIWQKDPGAYAPAYALVNIADYPHNTNFMVGGSYICIYAWVKEHDGTAMNWARLFEDRNIVRNMAEALGGVAW